MKKILNNSFKLLLAIAIIFWLVKNDKLDLHSSLKLLSSFYILAVIILIYAVQNLITSIRWKSILQLKSDKITNTKRVYLIQWIGQFFSAALPGGVTGDFIKLGYIQKMDEKLSKKFLLLSIFLDRLLGIIGLLLISGVGSFIFYNDLINLSPEMPKIIIANFVLLFGSLLVIGFFYLPQRFIEFFKNVVQIKQLTLIIEKAQAIKIRKGLLIKLLILSSLSHLLNMLAFHIINYNFYESPIRIRDLMTIIPIGQIAISIPISPAGLGVGHLAYQKLFSFINQTNGATLFNNYWILTFLVNLLGFIPFIFLRRLPTDK